MLTSTTSLTSLHPEGMVMNVGDVSTRLHQVGRHDNGQAAGIHEGVASSFGDTTQQIHHQTQTLHVMWYTCGCHVVHMWMSCDTHVEIMRHVAIMWISCDTHVDIMWYTRCHVIRVDVM